jgi:uncharacterized protein (TIGR03066 family)
MKALRWLAVAAVVSVSGGPAPAEDKPDYAKLIVGKWEVTKADDGTVPTGTKVEFTKDGKMKFNAQKDGSDVTLEGTYKLDGDKFEMTINVDGGEKTHTITITKLTDKELATKDENDKVVELARKK